MAPEALAQVLRPLENMFRAQQHPNFLVGLGVSDDAAVYKINDEVAIIQTMDFFPPIVDDPYDYGAIAAANAMSDVYAMGGEVVLALNICAFPPDLPPTVIGEILRGGAEKVAEAGGVVAGGHTLDDDVPKYGLSAMGTVHPDAVWTKGGARPDDVLVLTKPLGTGIITTALKGQVADPVHVAAAVESMKTLNRRAAHLLRQVGPNACTDITGFGLLGHSHEMATKGGVGLRFHVEQLPFLEGTQEYADMWLFPAGTCNNEQAYEHGVHFGTGVSEEMRQLLYTPETSGGLLTAIDPHKLSELTALCDEADQGCWVVGEVVEGEDVEVVGRL